MLTLLTNGSGREYKPEDLPFGLELARRIALALDNASLHATLSDAVRARDDFIAVASHDLRNPLTGLGLELSSLARAARGCPDGALSCAWALERSGRMSRQVGRMQVLIEDLLDVSRIQAGRLTLERAPTDLAQAVREVTGRLEATAAEAQSPLHVETPATLVGNWDPGRVDQVASNLVSNALKYGAGKPVHVTVRAEGRNAVLEVRDEGVGIAPEHHERIFQRFERAVHAPTFKGLGLGLWIVRQIVEAHRGTVRVESEPGRGALFVVVLPREGVERPG